MTIKDVKNQLDDGISINVITEDGKDKFKNNLLSSDVLKKVSEYDEKEIDSIGLSRDGKKVVLVLRTTVKVSSNFVTEVKYND